MTTIDVAISVTWRFEEMLVLLDILKHNFGGDFRTHVYCNLASIDQYNDVFDEALIDRFVHVPDQSCVVGNTDKIDTRRRQPLDFFINVIDDMSKKCDAFIYTECDVFPLDEDAYVRNFLSDGLIRGRFIDHVTPVKTPYGYMTSSPLYVSSSACDQLLSALRKNKKTYITSGYAFEGMLAHAIKSIAGSFATYSNHFCSNYDAFSNLEPVSMTTHQHDLFNLLGELRSRMIVNGKWISDLFMNDEIVRRWNGEKLMKRDQRYSYISRMPVA